MEKPKREQNSSVTVDTDRREFKETISNNGFIVRFDRTY